MLREKLLRSAEKLLDEVFLRQVHQRDDVVGGDVDRVGVEEPESFPMLEGLDQTGLPNLPADLL